MNKILSALIVAAVGSLSFSAFAGSHAGGAPMKAETPAAAASAAKKDAMPPAKKADAPKPAASATK